MLSALLRLSSLSMRDDRRIAGSTLADATVTLPGPGLLLAITGRLAPGAQLECFVDLAGVGRCHIQVLVGGVRRRGAGISIAGIGTGVIGGVVGAGRLLRGGILRIISGLLVVGRCLLGGAIRRDRRIGFRGSVDFRVGSVDHDGVGVVTVVVEDDGELHAVRYRRRIARSGGIRGFGCRVGRGVGCRV